MSHANFTIARASPNSNDTKAATATKSTAKVRAAAKANTAAIAHAKNMLIQPSAFLRPRHQPYIGVAKLRHSYFLLRHGKSVPNEQGLIVSSMFNGIDTRFGLAPSGRQQAAEAGALLYYHIVRHHQQHQRTLGSKSHSGEELVVNFVSSPFSRTVETAEIAREALVRRLRQSNDEFLRSEKGGGVTVRDVAKHVDLRERFFGDFELCPDKNYGRVWAEDEKHQAFGSPVAKPSEFKAEPTAQVWERFIATIRSLEHQKDETHSSSSKHDHQWFVIVAHGDILQIGHTGLLGHNVAMHRHAVPHMSQAELRRVGNTSNVDDDDALSPPSPHSVPSASSPLPLPTHSKL